MKLHEKKSRCDALAAYRLLGLDGFTHQPKFSLLPDMVDGWTRSHDLT